MRIVYLALAALAIGAMAFSGERPSPDGQQASMLSTLIGSRSQATADRLQVGDPVDPALLPSWR